MDYKREYIKMRNSLKYDLQFFFNYYLSQGGKVIDPNEFTENFFYTHTQPPVPKGFNPPIVRSGEIDRERVLNYMDGVFGLTILVSKEGQFLKIIE